MQHGSAGGDPDGAREGMGKGSWLLMARRRNIVHSRAVFWYYLGVGNPFLSRSKQ